MIEDRIKRALWAISVSVFLGFGAHAAYKFHLERAINDRADYVRAIISQRSDACASDRSSYACGTLPRWRVELGEAVQKTYTAGEEAETSAAIAITIPLVLWGLFLLSRWVWTGRVVKPRHPPTGKAIASRKTGLYWGLGLFGFAVLFGINVFVLPPGRAVAVLISSLVQALGIALFFWLVAKGRDLIKRQAERKRAG